MNTQLINKESIQAIIQEMTTEEKALLLTGKTAFTSYGIERFDIPSITYLDCASGINLMQYFMDVVGRLKQEKGVEEEGDGVFIVTMYSMTVVMDLMENWFEPEKLSPNSREVRDYIVNNILPGGKLPSCFPPGIALAASWNPPLIRRVGAAVGKEAAAFKVDLLLGSPNVNIFRDPRNGRLFEGFSEDPHLVSRTAPEIVKGVQEQGVGADVKHYAVNNQETQRMGINVHVSERALYEIYLPGFKACVQDGRAMTVMSAYNKINGVDCAMNRWLLTDVLKKEWGFDGFVVSDWGAAYDQVHAFAAGNDADMPGPRNIEPVVKAVRSGDLDEAILDEAARRFLSAVVDIKEARKTRFYDFDREYSRRAAYDMAADSVVLLKNKGGVLPLGKDCKVSFFGDKSKEFIASGKGSAYVLTDQVTSLYDETSKKIGESNIAFGEVKGDTDIVVITASLHSTEGKDHSDMDLLPDEKAMLLEAVSKGKRTGKKIIVILNSGNPIETQDFINDVDAFLWVFFPGMEGGRAVADILFGDVNPSGKLPITYPKRYKDCPSYGNFPGSSGEVWYGEDIFVGYRYYDTKDVEPLFPFGHGLSYTKFELSGLSLESDTWDMDSRDSMAIRLRVKNTGTREGKEVVQLYIAHKDPTLPKPVKELKCFEKVALAPGEEKEVFFTQPLNDLKSYDSGYGKWVAEPGEYTVLAGTSSRDLPLVATFFLKGHSIYDFGPNTSILKIMDEPRAVAVLHKHLDAYLDVDEFLNSFFLMLGTKICDGWYMVEKKVDKNIASQLFDAVCMDLRDIHISE